MKKMKYVFIVIALCCVCGCEKAKHTGIYKEGTYYGSVPFTSYGEKYVTTAVLYVDHYGDIQSCFIDSTYVKDGVKTTKKTLRDAYGMKETSNNMGILEGGREWYEQVEAIEKKVLEEQDLDWVKWTDQEKTKLDLDVISGVTISADTYIEAISKALEQAK